MKLGQKSVKNLVAFLGDLKTQNFHSEIIWPLKLASLQQASKKQQNNPLWTMKA